MITEHTTNIDSFKKNRSIRHFYKNKYYKRKNKAFAQNSSYETNFQSNRCKNRFVEIHLGWVETLNFFPDQDGLGSNF